jgi:magnesium transporter
VAAEHRLRAVYRPRGGALEEGADEAFIRRALADREGLLWLDLHPVPDQDGHLLDTVFGFHPLTIEDSIEPRVDPAKIDDHGDYIFIVVQALNRYEPGKELTSSEVDFFLGPNYVVSVHLEDVPAIDQFHELCLRDERLTSRGADWLLHGLLDALIDEYLPIVDAVDDEIDRLEERLLSRVDTQVLEHILQAKRTTLRLRRATTPQREILSRLSRGEFPRLISAEAAVYYRDVFDHLVRVDYLVESLRDLADGALQLYLSVVSNRLNEVMKILTAAATIFLPLTLISGVYGMNFVHNQFPPFDSTWGFAVVVGAMLTIAVSMMAYFRWRDWI